ncbi:hypothetical protein SORBI_3001G257600 [Sorghum bicolor]|uniref:Uncharacterized protein n=1 Tax=Sorghum bicolor TaxID=4558 RepID=A0A1Z5S7D9_SORBI|nr:hypothetical protein SORBI_3001G257600 [Sorghum bicolor]
MKQKLQLTKLNKRRAANQLIKYHHQQRRIQRAIETPRCHPSIDQQVAGWPKHQADRLLPAVAARKPPTGSTWPKSSESGGREQMCSPWRSSSGQAPWARGGAGDLQRGGAGDLQREGAGDRGAEDLQRGGAGDLQREGAGDLQREGARDLGLGSGGEARAWSNSGEACPCSKGHRRWRREGHRGLLLLLVSVAACGSKVEPRRHALQVQHVRYS